MYPVWERQWIVGHVLPHSGDMSDHSIAPVVPVEAYAPSYVAVFTAVRTGDQSGYGETAARRGNAGGWPRAPPAPAVPCRLIWTARKAGLSEFPALEGDRARESPGSGSSSLRTFVARGPSPPWPPSRYMRPAAPGAMLRGRFAW